MSISKLSKVEKEILLYHAKSNEGFSTSGSGESIYLNALSNFHPNEIRNALDQLESKEILRRFPHDSIRFTENGLHECRVHFKRYRFYRKIGKRFLSVLEYSLKNLLVPILVTIITTIALHYVLGDPIDQKTDEQKTEKKIDDAHNQRLQEDTQPRGPAVGRP